MRKTTNTSLSHSEHLRQQRQQHSQKRYTQVNTAVLELHTVTTRRPPVITRAAMPGFSTPIVQRAGTKKPRRKYSLVLGASGAEMILPAIPMVKVGWRLVSGLLVLFIGVALFLLTISPTFQVDVPIVKGNQRVTTADITTVLNLSGTPAYMVDPTTVKADLAKAFPEFSSIRLSLGIPAKLQIFVEERQPIISWKHGATSFWIDAYGSIFPVRGDARAMISINSDENPPFVIKATPKLETTAPKSKTPVKIVKAAALNKMDVLFTEKVDPNMLISAVKLSAILGADTTLVYTKDNGLGWTDGKGVQVFVGRDLTDIDAKLKVYQGVAEYLNAQGKNPRIISVEYINAPFYRLEQ